MSSSNLIRVGDRFFDYKVGQTYIGVWEELRVGKDKSLSCGRLSFVIPRPDVIDREQIRALILQEMGATKECER